MRVLQESQTGIASTGNQHTKLKAEPYLSRSSVIN